MGFQNRKYGGERTMKNGCLCSSERFGQDCGYSDGGAVTVRDTFFPRAAVSAEGSIRRRSAIRSRSVPDVRSDGVTPFHSTLKVIGMRKTMWQLLTATRGGTNRVRIIRALDEQPRNANQLAEDIGQDYNTIRYHLDMLVDNDILETEDSDYAKSYFLTDQFERHRKEYERILQTMD